MFQKILIANRGEIACRVIATARRMGIRTVAVYSDADAQARHVALADEAVHIGGAAVADSYLRADRIIDACRQTGARAIHPGYGFLSENPDFVEAAEAAGLVFIGPSATAIRAMGLKDAAKALMVEAGVPVVPGYHGQAQEPALLASEAEKIGYPILIKARAGGGGKGMRLVEHPAGFQAALDSARREAQASFGDPACLIEKYITHPRHIEIQVFGDSHGNVIHLFERDCSLQRRHQKVIEEAPAPDMPEKVRAAMGKAAVDAARAINYQGAGTVEFIVDGSGPLHEDGFWFMEMNTRLQVEHPVSEAITGLDFVELQLRVAAGDPLPVAQEDLRMSGWAFEARIYAEDVPKGFLPATGAISHLSFPQASEFTQGRVRLDSGLCQGDEISPWYDPMIAKLIVHGPTRALALNQLGMALAECRIAGCVTNLAFLSALTRHAGFARAEIDTGLIVRDIDALTQVVPPSDPLIGLAALGGLGLLKPTQSQDPWDTLTGWRHWNDATNYITLATDTARYDVQVNPLDQGQFRMHIDGRIFTLDVEQTATTRYRIHTATQQFNADMIVDRNRVQVFADASSYSFALPDPLAAAQQDSAGGDGVIAPMPGLVTLMSAEVGAEVAKGDVLLVLEAMKMEHALVAPRAGIVAELLTQKGDQVSDGALLVRLEAADD